MSSEPSAHKVCRAGATPHVRRKIKAPRICGGLFYCGVSSERAAREGAGDASVKHPYYVASVPLASYPIY